MNDINVRADTLKTAFSFRITWDKKKLSQEDHEIMEEIMDLKNQQILRTLKFTWQFSVEKK